MRIRRFGDEASRLLNEALEASSTERADEVRQGSSFIYIYIYIYNFGFMTSGGVRNGGFRGSLRGLLQYHE